MSDFLSRRRASTLSLLISAACTGTGGPGTKPPPASTDEDSGANDTSTTGSTETGWPDPEKVGVVINVEIDLAGLFLTNEDHGFSFVSLSVRAGTMVISEADPGTWWCVAYDAGDEACNRSDTVTVEAGDTIAWLVDELPGTFDPKTGDCMVP